MLTVRRSVRGLTPILAGTAVLTFGGCGSGEDDAFLGRWAPDHSDMWQLQLDELGEDASEAEIAVAREFFEVYFPPGEGMNLRFEPDGTLAVWSVFEPGNESEPNFATWSVEDGAAVVYQEDGASVLARGRIDGDRLTMEYENERGTVLHFARFAE